MSSEFRPRVYPAVLILSLIVIAAFVPAMIAPRTRLHFMGMFGGWLLAIVSTLLWWVAFSKVRGPMRWLPPVLFIASGAVAVAMYPGAQLGSNVLLSLLMTATLWLLAVVLTTSFGWESTRVAVPGSLLLAMAVTCSVRIDGTSADLWPELSWRWAKTPEQLAMEERGTTEKTTLNDFKLTPADWPQFRGVSQDSRVTGTTIRTDWDRNPPKELWRKRIGPGWGTFAVAGDYLFTQEQRGENEAVVCLKADSGTEAWSHETPGRFEEAISGAGPRATPTVAEGSVFAFGAMGTLTRLDVRDGRKIWEVNVSEATQTAPPIPAFWGFASSPFVAEGLVIVFVNGGLAGKGTAAFRVSDGSLAWASGVGTHGYCTAHRATLCGVDQILMPSDKGLEAFEIATGKILWTHEWPTPANRATQPVFLGNDELLLGTGYGIGTRRLKVTKSGDVWDITTVWESRHLKPYYNDAVLHNGLVFGFDDKAFVCVDPANGRRKWSAGTRYGFGQVLLLADQNVLLVMAENGKAVLVTPAGDDFVEQTSFKALGGKKTWNHPVVNRGRLYLRNGEEMVCYELTAK